MRTHTRARTHVHAHTHTRARTHAHTCTHIHTTGRSPWPSLKAGGQPRWGSALLRGRPRCGVPAQLSPRGPSASARGHVLGGRGRVFPDEATVTTSREPREEGGTLSKGRAAQQEGRPRKALGPQGAAGGCWGARQRSLSVTVRGRSGSRAPQMTAAERTWKSCSHRGSRKTQAPASPPRRAGPPPLFLASWSRPVLLPLQCV